MEVIKYVGGPVDANCYIVKFKTKAIIIDPCIKLDFVKKIIGNYKLELIIVTHGHADHICYLKEVEDYYKVPIYLAKNAKEKLENASFNLSNMIEKGFIVDYPEEVYHFVNDFEKINVDGEDITFIHTIGHSNCSICVRINDCLFSGDTLFKGSVGRCDLYTGNEAELRKTLKFLKNYLKNKCPSDLVIYPGHEEETTAYNELLYNPYLKFDL